MENETLIDIEPAAKALDNLGAELKKAIQKYDYDDVAGAFRKQYPFKLHQLEHFEIIDTIFTITKPGIKAHGLSIWGAMYHMKSSELINLMSISEGATKLRSTLQEQSMLDEDLNTFIAACEAIGDDAQSHLIERVSEYESDIKELTQTLNHSNHGKN